MAQTSATTLSTVLLLILALLAYVYITRHVPSRRDRRQETQPQLGLIKYKRADLGTQLRADGVEYVILPLMQT